VIVAARNLGARALRKLGAVHKPVVRLMRRSGRAREQAARAAEAAQAEREIAAVAAAAGPIVAGPWLAEVGYEVLYWLPFLRWFRDAYRIPPERITSVSRGGVEHWYEGIAGRYVDIFDHLTPGELTSLNEERQAREEGGGRKQHTRAALDERLMRIARGGRAADAAVLHPSLMFRLFRHVWHDSVPRDFFWRHTDYVMLSPPPRPRVPGLPAEYAAVKFYAGTAVPDDPANREALRGIVRELAGTMPVVALDTAHAFDDHADYLFDGIANVVSARQWMTPRNNLGLQTALAAHARRFVGTCGGLAWLMPFLGVPTVGVYADDRQLATHLLTARHAGRRAGAAEFSVLDLRAVRHCFPSHLSLAASPGARSRLG
jgi:hypothetical protein